MAEEKTQTKKPSIKTPAKPADEKEFVIPLREKCRPVARYKKTNKAVKTIKEYIVRHMKIRDRDLRKVKIDSYLNDALWSRGIKNPPHKIKVRVHMDPESNVAIVELADMPKKLEAKRAREEKREKAAAEAGMKKKKAAKPEEPVKPEEKTEEQKKEDFEEKKASVVEAGKEMEKAQHKQTRHASKEQAKSMVSQRQNLAR
jgi:large subunit ribosomal protein L31e